MLGVFLALQLNYVNVVMGSLVLKSDASMILSQEGNVTCVLKVYESLVSQRIG